MNSQAFKKLKIPDRPGVYFFLASPKLNAKTGKKREILYIGKATSLRDRTRSYFSKDLIQTRGPIIVDMVFKADTIEWKQTDSVLEALILEANLIKKYNPYYNTKEKDDKSFNYVVVTNESLPRVLVIRGKELKTNNYKLKTVFGPFPHGQQLREVLKIVRKIFPFLDAKSVTKGSYEFYKQLGLAPLLIEEGVGGGDLRRRSHHLALKGTPPRAGGDEYKKNIKNLILFFQGKKGTVVKNLEKEMYVLAKKREFERANEIKKKIFALKHIHDVALIKSDPVVDFGKARTHERPEGIAKIHYRVEAYDIAHMSGKNMVGVMTVVEGGEVNKNEYRKFIIKSQTSSNDTGALLEVLERRFTHTEWQMPSMIVLDGGVAQMNTALKFQERVGLKIPVVAVIKDERHKAKKILGDAKLVRQYEKEILLANSEAHRFAIGYHRQKRGKGMFL